MYTFDKHTKKIAAGLISFFLFVQVLLVFVPEPANAQLGSPDVVAALTGKWTSDSITEGILSASLGAVVNGFSYFMRKLAYDTASYLGSGGTGQGALAFQDGAGSYFSKVALDSAASSIEQFGSGFGLDLCKPPDLKFQIFLQVSIRKLYADPLAGGPQPKCSWSDFTKNWEKGLDNFDEKAGDFVAQSFARSLRVDQSDFGISYGLISKVDRINVNAKDGANTSRLEGGGFKAVTNLIAGNIKTPAQVIAEETKGLTANKQSTLSSQQIAGIYGAGLWQVIPAAAGVFINTLVSQLMETIMTDGILPDPSGGSTATESAVTSAFSEYAGVINNNKAAAQNAFNFLFSAVPIQQLDIYPLLEVMSDCSNPDNPGLNNCVIDPGFVQAIKRANTGKALTIREAMDAKNNFLLHPDWALVPPSHEYNADPRKCYNDNYYCYSNIQKLRRARIVPLGFEIAAAKADPDQLQNWTLGKVVDGFYDCDASGEPTPQKPFCHLIDPDWIIRLPEPRCDAKVFGPKLSSSENAARREECVGVSTCLEENDKGQCLGEYGYCLREKNTWRFGGSTCPEQFNSCVTYTNNADNSRASYLSRTVEYGQCNAQSVGCRVYSTEQKADGTWRTTGQPVNKISEITTGKNPAIYFNDSIKNYACSPTVNGVSPEGCSDLIRANPLPGQEKQAYLKKAPNTLFDACYLVKKTGATAKTWPDNDAEIAELAKRPESGLCKQFAPACTKDEAGCEAFTPTDGGDTVTGIVGANTCPKECVGYDTFKQEIPANKGAFEPSVFPLHFIPTDAGTCLPQYEGCSEFTNISEAGAGGEKLEYYSDLEYCEKPTGTNEKTFYSWEGSASTGYVLQTYKLRPISSDVNDRYNTVYMSSYLTELDKDPNYAGILNQFAAGSPAYVDDNFNTIIDNYNDCSQSAYEDMLKNPYVSGAAIADCRAFYTDAGLVYYRLLNKTVHVSPSCHPLRKTESFLRTDSVLTTLNNVQKTCETKGGKWTDGENSKCELCYNGGIYNNGACVYWTTSQPSEKNLSCPKEANNCRAYTGKAANNVQPILEQKFEPADDSATALTEAKGSWSTGQIKLESLVATQHSLEINADIAEYEFPANTFENNKSYGFEFWSRGTQQNLEIVFFDKTANTIVGNFTYNPVTAQTVKAPISSTWQSYKFGPVQFTGNGANKIVLRLTRTAVGASGPYYIDNLRLIKKDDTQFLIKNSWKRSMVIDEEGNTVMADVSDSCDEDPTDGLPGFALGCRAYTDSLKNSTQLTGFDRLCRAEAVGCTGFIDSQNTPDETNATAYNLWCAAAQNTKCTLTLAETELGVCDVPAGETGCFIAKTTLDSTVYEALLTPQGQTTVVKSTIIIPADTPATDPIYLSYRKEYSCDSANVGCQKVALEEHVIPNSTAPSAYKYTESLVKNNPDNYSQILCAAEQIGCSAFKSNNSVSYFKDPKTSGAPVCVYKDPTKGSDKSGWFQEGVGKCTAVDPAQSSGTLCKTNSDCTAGESCPSESIGTVPCYSNYLIAGGEYGLWSNKSANYNGSVGRCAEQYNQCVELIDPLDTSGGKDKAGKPYYVIFDQKLLQNSGQCDNKVNLKQGCALFNLTNQPTMLYNAAETYKISDGLNTNGTDKYGPTEPVKTGTLDTNELLKVDRDRSCSEWLGCKDKVRVTDATGKQRTICTQYKACRSTQTGLACTEWSSLTENNTERLTEDRYIGRNVSWYGEDYSGYSIFNKYQLSDTVSVAFDGDPVAYLAFLLNPVALGSDPTFIKENGCSQKNDWDLCGVDKGGRCYEKKCLYPLGGAFPADVKGVTGAKKFLEGGLCKAFPEQTSPFPSSIIKKSILKNPAFKTDVLGYNRIESQENIIGFAKANVCQDGDCSCEYKKITYKNGIVDYRSATSSEDYPQGICSDGDKGGWACEKDSNCDVVTDTGLVPGKCNKINTVETRNGLRGFCLERDYSRPINRATNEYACLTWLPVDTAASNFDQYNKFPEAGYYPAFDAVKTSADGKLAGEFGKVYCTEATGNGLGAINKDLYTCLFTDCKTDDIFDFNKAIYSSVFNKYGDYTGDQEGDQVNFFGEPLDPPHFKAFGGPFVPSGAPDEIIGLRVDDNNYVKHLYSMMQMWSWAGGMYGKGLSSVLGLDTGVTFQKADGTPPNDINNSTKGNFKIIKTSPEYNAIKKENPFENGVPYPNAVVLFTSSLFYHDYMFTSHEKLIGHYYGDSVYDYWKYYEPFLLSSYAPNYHPQVKSYWANAKVYENEIKALHFGPILAPANMKSRVLTIDFDKLNNFTSDCKGTGTTANNVKYNYSCYSAFDDESGQFVFKLYKEDTGETIYGVTALSTRPSLDHWGSGKGKFSLLKMYVSDNEIVNMQKNPIDLFKGYFEKLVDPKLVDSDKKLTYWLSSAIDWNHDWYTGPLGPAADGSNWTVPNSSLAIACFFKDGFKESCSFGASYSSQYDSICTDGGSICVARPGNLNDNGDSRFQKYFGDKGQDKNATPYLTEVAELKPRCAQFAQVYDGDANDPAKTTNKAWTNRVWKNASPPDSNFVGSVFNEIKNTTDLPPFGSTNLTPASLSGSTWQQDLRLYIFDELATDGAFFNCNGSPLEVPTSFKQGLAGKLFDSWTDFSCYKPENPKAEIYSKIKNDSNDPKDFGGAGSGKESLQNLFIKSFKELAFDTKTPESTDLSGNYVKLLTPPQIYSLNLDRCFSISNEIGKKCVAKEANAFTLNRSNGDNGTSDPFIAKSSFTAVADFFAFADHNRMPIKRVMIDWGDGLITNQKQYGDYKNHKPFCLTDDTDPNPKMGECSISKQVTCLDKSDCPLSTEKCDVNGHNFGNSTRACETNYFEYVHGYSCSQTDVETKALYVYSFNDPKFDAQLWAELENQGYTATKNPHVCIFNPKVQVLDNWGWCTGKCTDFNGDKVTDYKDGCYSDFKPPFGDNIDQCVLEKPGSFIPFKGNIVVVPQ